MDWKVGDTYSVERTVDPLRPLYYAAVSGDFNPIHLDPSIGEAAGLGGTILQGMCTYAWMVDAVSRWVGDPTRIASSFARFTKPVRPGDTVTFDLSVSDVGQILTVIDVHARNQHGDEVLRGGRVEVRSAAGGVR